MTHYTFVVLPLIQGSEHVTNYCAVVLGKSYYLDCSFSGIQAATAVNAAQDFVDMIEKWGITRKLAGLVTDTPATMKVRVFFLV